MNISLVELILGAAVVLHAQRRFLKMSSNEKELNSEGTLLLQLQIVKAYDAFATVKDPHHERMHLGTFPHIHGPQST